MTKNNPFLTESEYDIAGRTHFVEKKERILRPAASSAMPTTRGQRYTETNDCQTPIKKKQNWQIE